MDQDRQGDKCHWLIWRNPVWMMMANLEVWLEVSTLAQSGPEWEAGGELLQDGGDKMAATTRTGNAALNTWTLCGFKCVILFCKDKFLIFLNLACIKVALISILATLCQVYYFLLVQVWIWLENVWVVMETSPKSEQRCTWKGLNRCWKLYFFWIFMNL